MKALLVMIVAAMIESVSTATVVSAASAKVSDHFVVPKFVLDRYDALMLSTHTPQIMTFEYRVEQAGDHSITQVHRVYRNALMERDELLGVDDMKLKPKIRIFRNRPNAYAYENIAPRKGMYTFTFAGRVRNGNHTDYIYHTTPLNHLTPFTVNSIMIDGQTYMPTAIAFTTMSPTASGSGSVRYAQFENGWVVNEAEASAVIGRKTIREHFVFTNYHFPKSLPASTFGNME